MMDMAKLPFVANDQDFSFHGTKLDEVADPDPSWAAENPDLAFAFFFVSPRPCAALDRLLA